MATINADGTTSDRPRFLGAEGTSWRGEIRASYDQLIRTFGEPDIDSRHHAHPYVQWALLIRTPDTRAPNEYATICNPPGRPVLALTNAPVTWEVGGHVGYVVQLIQAALAGRALGTVVRGYILAHDGAAKSAVSQALRDTDPANTGLGMVLVGDRPDRSRARDRCAWKIELIERQEPIATGGPRLHLELRLRGEAWSALQDCPWLFEEIASLQREGRASVEALIQVLRRYGVSDETDWPVETDR